ncbi:MAG: selenocysteine-specific translation elongation factor [Defluviitaleaceae bacterium]|nr:selenocysteine-specific translation elongation factor [Defluviitaleaceae bacterium]
MNNAIIGTAGHVDHGKTALIRALTGIETDRLKEEKKRGITIELGFAYLTLPNGEKAGIVDVPGHEKFVRNMLSGAGSIDLAMLVIAADEGIMPQTREHLAILNMLGIQRGLVVLNKADLVDGEWLDMVMLDIEDELAGSFLEGCDIIPVSAITGQGVDTLRSKIFDMLSVAPAKKTNSPFRMPIDRVFTMDGFGTVATGTLIEGTLSLGDDVQIYPAGLMTKARRIQVHGGEVVAAVAGQRVAVNLAGLKVADLQRGFWAAQANSLENSTLVDVVVEIDKNMEREIKNNSRLHLHYGAGDVLCNILLTDERKMLQAGERAYAQLRLAEPIAARIYDRFVLRFYSPIETVGGGIILDPVAKHSRRKAKDTPQTPVSQRLAVMENGSLAEKIEVIFAHRSPEFPKISEIAARYFSDYEDFDYQKNQLILSKKLIKLDEHIVHADYLQFLGEKARGLLKRYHIANPLHEGMAAKELSSRILPKLAQGLAMDVFTALSDCGFIRQNGQIIADIDFKPTFSETHAKIEQELLKMYADGGFSPSDFKEVADKYSQGQAKDKKAFEQTFAAMLSQGKLIAITPQIHLHNEHCDAALAIFKEMAAQGGEVLTKDFRDKLDTSRKFAMAILEYFDKKGITKMVGEGRILRG